MEYVGRMDPECIPLCDAINRVPHVDTVESCCGHGNFPFRVYLVVDDIRYMAPLVFYSSHCQMGFVWNTRLQTDCTMHPPYLIFESIEVGEEAYNQANRIAECINAFMDDYKDEDPGAGFTEWERQFIRED